MHRKHLGVLIKLASSILGAAVCYLGWLAVFLLTDQWDSAVWALALWLLAPVVTAIGFAAGVVLVERRMVHDRALFWRVYPWPLIGCALGAGVVYSFGPMLIVFGMFAAGTACVVLREFAIHRRQ
jgi:hypothetical protein